MKNKTVDYYNQNAEKWEERTVKADNSYRIKIVKEFKKIMSKGRIIELGCGTGLDAVILTKNGYEYCGIDVSKELLLIAKKNLPDGNFLQMDLEKMSFKDNSFDGFWASASLLHVSKDKIGGILNKIKKICKMGSSGFISLKVGDGEELDKETGLFFAYYQKQEIQKILENYGFKIVKIEITKDVLNREGQGWMWIFLKI